MVRKVAKNVITNKGKDRQGKQKKQRQKFRPVAKIAAAGNGGKDWQRKQRQKYRPETPNPDR